MFHGLDLHVGPFLLEDIPWIHDSKTLPTLLPRRWQSAGSSRSAGSQVKSPSRVIIHSNHRLPDKKSPGTEAMEHASIAIERCSEKRRDSDLRPMLIDKRIIIQKHGHR